MNIRLTEDEITTVLIALDYYRDAKEGDFLNTRIEDDQTESQSAEWCRQKIMGQRDTQLNNAVADAVGEGDKSSNIDPYDFTGLEY